MKALVLLAVPTIAWAQPSTMTMRYTEGSNRHLAGGHGALSRHADVVITVELRAGGKLLATASGTRVDHAFDGGPSSRNTDDTATWTTQWTGRWAKGRASLTLDLVLATHACTRTRTTSEFDTARSLWVEYAPEPRSCQAAARTSRITCARTAVVVDGATSPRSVASWRCRVVPGTALAETPSTWVLGVAECIEVTSGGAATATYARCTRASP